MITEDDLAPFLAERVSVLRGLDPDLLAVTPVPDEAGGPLYCLVELGEEDEALMVRLPPDVEVEGLGGQAGGPRRPAAEAHNLAQAERLGLAPATLQLDPDTGLWAYPLWSGVPINVAVAHDPEVIERIGRALRMLHASGLVFRGRTDPFAGLEGAGDWTPESAAGLPVRDLTMLRDMIGQCREVLSLDAVAPAPCINAPAPEACFDTGTRVVFLDWRASAMGDPHHELARLSERAGFNAEQVTLLLAAYTADATETARDRVLVYRLVSAYRRLLEQFTENTTDSATLDPDVAQHRLHARLEACQMILESASWTGAMDRMRGRVQRVGEADRAGVGTGAAFGRPRMRVVGTAEGQGGGQGGGQDGDRPGDGSSRPRIRIKPR